MQGGIPNSFTKYVDRKRVRDTDAPYVIQDFKSCLKSQDLSPELGMRIYNSFIVENKMDGLIPRPT